MSTHTTAGVPRTADDSYARAGHGAGWVTFAGTMLLVVGTLNMVYGIAAIDDANVYVGDTKYVFGELNTWGWILALVGAAQFVTAFGIWNRAQWARWAGVGSGRLASVVARSA